MNNTRRRTTQRRVVTLDHVWLAAALILLALRPLLTPVPPHDFWWHLAMGRVIVRAGAIPTADRFSWTAAGQPFYDQSWLAQVLMYGLHALGGLALLIVAQALVITLAYGLLLRLCVRRTGRLRLCVGVLLLALPLVFDNWTIRPQSYAFPLFVGFLTVLDDDRYGRARRLWLLPPLMALWVNIHGSFVLGLALVGLTFIGALLPTTDQRRPTNDDQSPNPRPQSPISNLHSPVARLQSLALWGALTAAATLLNPRGFGVWQYVRDLTSNSAVKTLVTEWSPPTLGTAGGVIFFVSVALSVAALLLTRQRRDPTDLLMFGALLLLAFSATRNIVWFGFVAVPVLAAQIAARLGTPPARRAAGSSALNAALVAMLALLLVGALPWFKGALFPPSVGALLGAETPVAAVQWLRGQPQRPQRLFHDLGYGSYMTWAAPEQPVFIDPRIELYPFEQWRDYINLGQAVTAADIMQKYHFDGMLLDKTTQQPLIAALRRDPAWAARYEDARTVYFAATR